MWKRVVAPTLLVSLLWIAVSGVTTYHIQQIYQSHTRTLTEDVATIEAAWAMRRDLWKLQAVFESAQRDLRGARPEILDLERTFEQSLRKAELTSLTAPEQQLVKTLRQRFDAYTTHLRELWTRSATEPIQPSLADREKTLRLASAVGDTCRELSQVNQRLIEEETNRSHRLHASINYIRWTFGIAGPVLGLLFGMAVARGLNRSLSKIRITLQDATGKLGELGSVAVSTSDDLPALQQQVQVVADRIRQVVLELEDTRRRAIQSERLAAVGELAAGVAHEIRNPLTSVKLLIQNASQRHPAGAMSEKQFEVVLREISRMESTIQGLLDFARPAALRRINHDLRQTLRRALNLVQGRAEHQKVTILEELPDAPLNANADPEQLQLVFVNLAINAIEALPKGGKIRVVASRSDDHLFIRFHDTGPGIPQQILNRIFEPFVTGKERGTGLGLAISRRIVQEHGGTLLAANQPAGGAVLTVQLPVSQSAPGADTASQAESEMTHAQTSGH